MHDHLRLVMRYDKAIALPSNKLIYSYL
jgi:hypothetical protein